jgi:hypothetical protein
MISLRGVLAVGRKLKACADISSVRYAHAANRVAEVEALLARQKGKVDALERLGFGDEADAERSLLVKIEDLLQLCIEDRERVCRFTTSDSIH